MIFYLFIFIQYVSIITHNLYSYTHRVMNVFLTRNVYYFYTFCEFSYTCFYQCSHDVVHLRNNVTPNLYITISYGVKYNSQV